MCDFRHIPRTGFQALSTQPIFSPFYLLPGRPNLVELMRQPLTPEVEMKMPPAFANGISGQTRPYF
jgi:hypothetical protein